MAALFRWFHHFLRVIFGFLSRIETFNCHHKEVDVEAKHKQVGNKVSIIFCFLCDIFFLLIFRDVDSEDCLIRLGTIDDLHFLQRNHVKRRIGWNFVGDHRNILRNISRVK